jgi:hypothetical protein
VVSLLYGDDTTARILSSIEENTTRVKGERRGVYTTGVVASPVIGLDGHRIALYFSGRRHAGENVAELLAKRPAECSPPMNCDRTASSVADGTTFRSADIACLRGEVSPRRRPYAPHPPCRTHAHRTATTCGSIRTKLLKIGAAVRVSVRRVLVSLTSAYPLQELCTGVHERIRTLPQRC